MPPEPETSTEATWWVYVLRSTQQARSYVGIALDIEQRLAQHNGERPGGAKSTRPGRPWELVCEHGPFPTRSVAQRVEYAVKRLSGAQRWTYAPLACLGTDHD
ncbi:MAG: GIY-YIG nuclease family protein [Planctomycetota bacterium]